MNLYDGPGNGYDVAHNPDLPHLFRDGIEGPERPCTFCNRCTLRTTVAPLGCYDPTRFASQEEMEAQILAWFSPD